MQLEDTEIIKGCINGSRVHQKLLYEKYASKLLYLCLRYTKNKSEAEDVLQETFIKIFKNIQLFRSEGSFEGWIKRIAVNSALEFLRNKKHTLIFQDIEDQANYSLSDDDIIGKINAKELTELIFKLPDGYRLVFNLFVIEGYGHKEIGEMLEITEGTSKSQLAKARAQLQKSIHGLLDVTINQKD